MPDERSGPFSSSCPPPISAPRVITDNQIGTGQHRDPMQAPLRGKPFPELP
jgi:hypothetical protein